MSENKKAASLPSKIRAGIMPNGIKAACASILFDYDLSTPEGVKAAQETVSEINEWIASLEEAIKEKKIQNEAKP